MQTFSIAEIIDGFEPIDFNNAGLYGSQILHGVGVNIKCGNSLVEPDILERFSCISENLEELAATNVFDYKTAFAIFSVAAASTMLLAILHTLK